MEMPEIWQEVCLAFASWPEVVGLSICGLVLKNNPQKARNQCILIPCTPYKKQLKEAETVY